LPFTVKIAQDINTIALQNLASDWSAKATGGKNLSPGVLVGLDHVSGRILNANHRIV
jgi:hypothetical protein